jgi:hypothetical protein
MTQMERIQVPTQPQYRDGFRIGQAAVARNARAVEMERAAEAAARLLTTEYLDETFAGMHRRILADAQAEIARADAVLRGMN